MAKSKVKKETQVRVRYIFDSSWGPNSKVYTHIDDWYGPTPDGAAAYPWLMDNCVVWVETRTVTKTPWEVSDGITATPRDSPPGAP